MTKIRNREQERYGAPLWAVRSNGLLFVMFLVIFAGAAAINVSSPVQAQSCPNTSSGGGSGDESTPTAEDACEFTDPDDDLGCCNTDDDDTADDVGSVVWARDSGPPGHSDDGKYYAQCVAMGGDNGDKWVSLNGTVELGSCSNKDSVNDVNARPLEYCGTNNKLYEYYALCTDGNCDGEGHIQQSDFMYCELGQGYCPLLDPATQAEDPANHIGPTHDGKTCNDNYILGGNALLRYENGVVGFCMPAPIPDYCDLNGDFVPDDMNGDGVVDDADKECFYIDLMWVDVTPDCSTGETCPPEDAGTWTELADGTWEFCAAGGVANTTDYCDLDGDGNNDDINNDGVVNDADKQCVTGAQYLDGQKYEYVRSCCDGDGCGNPTWELFDACEQGNGSPSVGEKAVASFDGVAYYCDGVGWEKFPDIEVVVNCPVPELGDAGLHPFADEEHVRALEHAFYGIEPEEDGEYIEPDDGLVDEQGEGEGWLGPLFQFGEEMVENLMWQAFTIGTFFDAEQQLEAQRTMQILKAESHQRYKPDEQLCRFGTNVRSLVSSSVMAEVSTHNINQAMARREYGQEHVPSAKGYAFDLDQRLWHFRNTYCDPAEANGAIEVVCDNGGGPSHRVNKDVSFTRTVDQPFTLDLDFTDTVVTEDEEDILALGANLYAHRVFPEIPREYLKEEYVHDEVMDMRSIHALRSVARNSYAHITGMKTAGSGEVDDFMFRLLLEVGVSEADVEAFLGENPSYFAQMEVLTKLIYQSPEFYTNLYTNTENVSRIGVALQAIDLMQDRDRYEAALRREMLVSLILEMGLRERQRMLTTDTLQDLSALYPILPY